MRIKSYAGVGGLVSTVTYEDICMTGVKDLLDFTPFYATATGTSIPDYTNIMVDGAKAVSSASGKRSLLQLPLLPRPVRDWPFSPRINGVE